MWTHLIESLTFGMSLSLSSSSISQCLCFKVTSFTIISKSRFPQLVSTVSILLRFWIKSSFLFKLNEDSLQVSSSSCEIWNDCSILAIWKICQTLNFVKKNESFVPAIQLWITATGNFECFSFHSMMYWVNWM